MSPINIHGTGLVLGETGVLLRGPSGSGKSLLALALLDRFGAAGMLVADDRIDIVPGNPLTMQVPPAIAGKIELRGRGIIERPWRNEAPLHLIVDLVPELIRMPDPTQFVTELAGTLLWRAPVAAAPAIGLGHQVLLVAQALASCKGQPTRP